MMEALQNEQVIGKLEGLGYETVLYVFSMAEPLVSFASGVLFGVFALGGNQPKPFIMSFAEKGIALLELNAMCSKYTGLHTFIAVENIEEVSFKKGLLINKLTLRIKDNNEQTFKISKVTAGVPWQKANVERLQKFLSTVFRARD